MAVQSRAQGGCKMTREEHYRCDPDNLAKKLAEAHTISVSARRTDLFAADRTSQLVVKLGKQVAPPDQKGDLTFEVVPVDRNGHMDLGPADIPLARLNVYNASHELIWVTTLDGQPEIPWNADVIELLKHFQAEIVGSKA